MTDLDFIAENWWATVSGAGTDDAVVESWADDYTRHRSTLPTVSSTTYSGITDFTRHDGANAPTDLLQGRVKTGRELDKAKV